MEHEYGTEVRCRDRRLRAVSALLTGVKPDATTAFVLAMHLDPDRTSHMAELLQRTTRLTVVEDRKRTA